MSATAVPEYRNLVGGELVAAVEGATREVLNPATGEVIALVPEGSAADVERAVAATREARLAWRDTTPGRRQELLLALADVIDRHAGELAAELIADILPEGVLNVVTGDGPNIGEAIVRHPEISMVSLTGSVGTGKGIARAAADTLKRVHLELGGKAPVIVFDDADPKALAEGLRVASFCNSGQDCTAASRVLAAPGIYEAVLEELLPATSSLVVGDPAEGDGVEMGPVISARQQQRVLGFLDRATSSGAEVVTGGGTGRDAGFFVEPTVVTRVDQHG